LKVKVVEVVAVFAAASVATARMVYELRFVNQAEAASIDQFGKVSVAGISTSPADENELVFGSQ
jgi:hypothetical protein